MKFLAFDASDALFLYGRRSALLPIFFARFVVSSQP